VSGIIALLIQLVGPLIPVLIENCTKKTLKAAAKDLPPADEFESEGAAATALIDAAIANLRKGAVVRRKALLALKQKAVVGSKVRRAPLTAAELKEGKKLVKGIRV
jgi:hypothetical protein